MDLLLEHAAKLPILLAFVVWGIEWYGHKLHKPWSFELGIPVGGKRELLAAVIPTPVPEHWLASFNVEAIAGPRLTFTPERDDDTPGTCFGMLTLTRVGDQTEARYVRRASFGPLAFAAAVVAAARMDGVSLELAVGGGGVVLLFWLFGVLRDKRRLDETYEVLSASILRSAVERSV